MQNSKVFINVAFILVLLVTALGNTSVDVQAGSSDDILKADPRLLQMAADNPDATFMVIVQKEAKNKDLKDMAVEEEVLKGGGRVKKQLDLIVSVSAEMTGKEITKLARHPKVRWISVDAPLFSTGTFTFSVADLFNVPASYKGNDGVYNWTTAWQEIGEGDGGGAGVVTVAASSNCASANNCLRFGGSASLSYEGRGVSRTVDLSDAPSATFSFSYRRASATGTTGSVSAQVSGDGGATWTNLSTIALNATDSSQKTLSIDISAYRAVNTQVRFLGAGSSNRSIYIDNISVSYQVPTNLLKAPTTEAILDTFASTNYTGSDGTKSWSSAWIETDAGGTGATAGNIRAGSGSKCWNLTGACLQILTKAEGDKIYRKVDLSTATSATLTLWRNNQMANQNNNQITLEASKDGNTWTTLRTWRDVTDDIGTANESFDLTPFIGSNTMIRINVLKRGGDGYLFFDNILVQYTTLQNVYPAAIRADKAWKKPPYLDGQGVTVAVVDSGFSSNLDFQVYGGGGARVVAAADMVSTPPDTNDGYGHGTHVGGIIAGNGNQSNGARTGVAPGANLVNVKVADANGMSYASDLVDGLQWIYNNRVTYNIKVVNISMNSTVAESYQTSPINAAVEILWFNGIVVVVSAGNSGAGTLYPPANDPFVITVGATDDMGTVSLSDDTVASFSAYGLTEDGFAKPDLVAPGRNILSLLASTNASAYTEHPDNRVDTYLFRMSGTSMSAPMVSGAVALLLQNEPGLNPDQVKYRLMETANNSWACTPNSCLLFESGSYGAGYLDIYAAIKSRSTASANIGLQPSQLLSTGSEPIMWGSVGWNSVGWNSVGWNSVGWNTVGWNTVGWNTVGWNTDYWGP
jgi:serine protease AprX